MATKKEKALINWLTAWQNKKYADMLEFSQISWVHNGGSVEKGKRPENIPYNKNLFKNTELLEFEIISSHPCKYGDQTLEEKVIIDFTVACKIFYKLVPICKTEVRLIRLIQEDKNGEATLTKGSWGVRPQSSLRKVDTDFLNLGVQNPTFENLVKEMKDNCNTELQLKHSEF